MPTINVAPGSAHELQEIADVLGKSKKVIVVTGAGISTNCGIPDFRSENGLYSMIQAQYDEALKNPPWQTKDEFDIDDRPKKKRRRWYYEVVKEDGEVVQVIDDELERAEEPSQETLSRRGSTLDSPQQQTSENTTCSSPLSSPPPSLPDSATQSTVASSVASTRSQSPVESSQPSQASRQDLPNLKGKDLFDCMVWKDPFTTSIFYMFISKFRETVFQDSTKPSPTHHFIKTLRDAGRLVRNYTQNIDCMEESMGLSVELGLGPGNKARFATKNQRQPRLSVVERDSAHDGGVEVVQLHGSLLALRCGICGKCCSWDDSARQSATLSGHAPDCPSCVDASQQRAGKGRRGLAVGRLRPDIVLYGEEHPSAGLVAPLITHDIALSPDVLLILGTSLRVHGLKVMVKEFAKAVHNRGGKVVFVNNTKPPESTWGDIIDYWVGWDCDEWVLDLKKRREDLWHPQGFAAEEKKAKRESMTSKLKKESSTVDQVEKKRPERKDPGRVHPPRPQAVRDCKRNGAYFTFKILDLLGKEKDQDGNGASRAVLWDTTKRRSTGDSITLKRKLSALAREPKTSVSDSTNTTQQAKSEKRKSLPSAPLSAHTANSSKPRRPRASLPKERKADHLDESITYHRQELSKYTSPPGSKFLPTAALNKHVNNHPNIAQYFVSSPTEFKATWERTNIPLPDLKSHPSPFHNRRPSFPPFPIPQLYHKGGTFVDGINSASAYSDRRKPSFHIPVLPGLSSPCLQPLFQEQTPPDSSPSAIIKDKSSIGAILSSPLNASFTSSSSNETFYDAQEHLC